MQIATSAVRDFVAGRRDEVWGRPMDVPALFSDKFQQSVSLNRRCLRFSSSSACRTFLLCYCDALTVQTVQKTAEIPQVRVQFLVGFDMPVVEKRLAPGAGNACSCGVPQLQCSGGGNGGRVGGGRPRLYAFSRCRSSSHRFVHAPSCCRGHTRTCRFCLTQTTTTTQSGEAPF